MKRDFKIVIAIAGLLLAVPFFAQAPIPSINYDAVDFLKPAANLAIGEVAGVATNSKGNVMRKVKRN